MDSAWAGLIPSAWEVAPLRRLARLYAGGTPSRDIPGFWQDGTVPWLSSGEVNQWTITKPTSYITEEGLHGSSARWIPSGSLVMALAGQGRTKGMVAQLELRATCNQSMVAIVPSPLVRSRFLLWWLHAHYQTIRSLAGGEQRDGLNLEIVGDIPIPLPSLTTQTAIADYLDHETGRVADLVAKRRRMGMLLRERLVAARRERFALGVGESKEISLRRLVTCLDGRRIPLNREERALRPGPFPYWGAGSIVDYIDGYLFAEELVLLGEDGAPFFDDSRDVAFRTDGRVWVNNHIHVLRCNAGTDSRWLRHMLNAVDYRAYISGSTRDKLTQDEMMDIRLPGLDEADQRLVADELDAIENAISTTAVEIEKQIALMTEHRQALITAAVTGQLEIPEAA